MPPVINVARLNLQVANLFGKSVGIARDTTHSLKACHKPSLPPIFAWCVYLKFLLPIFILKYMAFNLVCINYRLFVGIKR